MIVFLILTVIIIYLIIRFPILKTIKIWRFSKSTKLEWGFIFKPTRKKILLTTIILISMTIIVFTPFWLFFLAFLYPFLGGNDNCISLLTGLIGYLINPIGMAMQDVITKYGMYCGDYHSGEIFPFILLAPIFALTGVGIYYFIACIISVDLKNLKELKKN